MVTEVAVASKVTSPVCSVNVPLELFVQSPSTVMSQEAEEQLEAETSKVEFAVVMAKSWSILTSVPWTVMVAAPVFDILRSKKS